MQQKYCDHGRSTAVLTITWPIMPGAQFLRLRRKAQKGVDLSFHEQLDRLERGIGDPVDILGGVQPDMRGHQSYQHVSG